MIEIWSDGKNDLILRASPSSDNYLKFRNRTWWIAGITRYWLLENGYKQYA